MMATASIQYQHLAPSSKSSYKQLFVKGTRLRARALYGAFLSEEEPRSIEEIAADYKLPVQAVREAIAYCESNPPELLEDYRREAALVAASKPIEGGGHDSAASKHLTPEEIAKIRRAASKE